MFFKILYFSRTSRGMGESVYAIWTMWDTRRRGWKILILAGRPLWMAPYPFDSYVLTLLPAGKKRDEDGQCCQKSNEDGQCCLQGSRRHKEKNDVHPLDCVFRLLAPVVYIVFCFVYFCYYMREWKVIELVSFRHKSISQGLGRCRS